MGQPLLSFGHDARHIQRPHLHFHLAHTSEQQQLVNDAAHLAPHADDGFQVFPLLFRLDAVQPVVQQVGIADDGRQRGLEVMGHRIVERAQLLVVGLQLLLGQEGVLNNLRTAVGKKSEIKDHAKKDLEFAKYAENEAFTSIVE